MAASFKPAEVCYFTDCLSVEIRVSVYKHIFGSAPYARSFVVDGNETTSPASVHERTNGVKRIDISVFQTNKLIYNEALDAFLDSRTIRVTFHQLQTLLTRTGVSSLVRNVQIIDCRLFAGDSADIHRILKTVCGLEKIKDVVILTDSLAEQAVERSFKTTRQWTKYHKLRGLVCTDVGKYEVRNKMGTFKMQNSKIVKMWPEVASTPPNFDAVRAAFDIADGWDIRAETSHPFIWASHTSLRIWVGLYDLMLKTLHQTPGVTSTSRTRGDVLLVDWAENAIGRNPDLSFLSESHYDGVGVHKFGLHTDKTVLENFSELLAVNIEAYWCIREIPGYPGRWRPKLAKPIWPALSDEESEGARQARAEKEYRRTSFIECPVNCTEWHIDLIRRTLIKCPRVKSLLGEMAISEADKGQLQSIWYYLLAMKVSIELLCPVQQVGLEGAADKVYKWCKELLVDYLLAASGIALDDLKDITLADARQLFKHAEEFSRFGIFKTTASSRSAHSTKPTEQHEATGQTPSTCDCPKTYTVHGMNHVNVLVKGPSSCCENPEIFLAATEMSHVTMHKKPTRCPMYNPLLEKLRHALHVMVLLYQQGMLP